MSDCEALMHVALDSTSPLLDAPGNWGDYCIIDAEPLITEANDHVYRPWSATEPWGLSADTDLASIEVLSGDFLYCGTFNCHFGHFLIDTVARLWSLKDGRASRLLFHSSEPPSSWFARAYVCDIMSALSISVDDIVVINKPVRLGHLRIVETSMREQCYIHRVFGDLCRTLGQRFGLKHRPAATGKLAYFSRSRLTIGTAKFVNEADLDQALSRLGVEVIYPETLTLREQIERMHAARAVMGITGSALHLSAFCGDKTIVGVSAGQLVNSNFRMIDAVCGNRASYVYPRDLTLVETPPGFHAAWRLEDPSGVAQALVSLTESLLVAPDSNTGDKPTSLPMDR